MAGNCRDRRGSGRCHPSDRVQGAPIGFALDTTTGCLETASSFAGSLLLDSQAANWAKMSGGTTQKHASRTLRIICNPPNVPGPGGRIELAPVIKHSVTRHVGRGPMIVFPIATIGCGD